MIRMHKTIVNIIVSVTVFAIIIMLFSLQTHAAYDRYWATDHIVESVETAAYINGQQVVLRIQTDDDGDLYFALRGLMEYLGYYVGWNASDLSIDMINSENTFHVKAWDANCETNEGAIELDEPVFIENGYSYIHQSFITKMLGLDIVRVDRAADSSESLFSVYIEANIDMFWDNLVSIPDSHTGLDLYWRYIDDNIIEETDYFIDQYGVDVLFTGLKSSNEYSQYYCINRLVEQYNQDDIRERALMEIEPFLNSANETIKQGAEFAIDVLSKNFNNHYILDAGGGGSYIFSLFNDYSDYGSYNELWMVKDDILTKLYSFDSSGLSEYIDTSEPMRLSPGKDKLAVQTCSRRSSSVNIINLSNGEVSAELMLMALDIVAAENRDYVNTYTSGPDTAYAGGEYCWGGNLKWIDNDTLEFEAILAYNYGDISEHVIVNYNVVENSLVTFPQDD